MPATVHVVARLRAKPGKVDALKTALSALVMPSRRELACYQYDLLQNASDPHDFCFIERWESDQALDHHGASDHVRKAGEQIADLVEGPAEISRFRQI